MGLRFLFIIAVILSFTGKTTYLSLANLEIGELEISEISESKDSASEEPRSEFYSLLAEFIVPSFLSFSHFSIVVRSLVSSHIASRCMNRGPPILV